jgi:hypothetical protein
MNRIERRSPTGEVHEGPEMTRREGRRLEPQRSPVEILAVSDNLERLLGRDDGP